MTYDNRPRRRLVAVLFVVMIVVYLVAVKTVDGFRNQSTTGMTVGQVLESGWGFNSSESYPMQTGGPIEGSSGSINATTEFSLFGGYTSVSGNITPSAAIRLGMNHKGVSYIVVIPTDEVRFHVVHDGTMAHARFTVKNDVVDTVSLVAVRQSGSTWLFNHTDVWGPPSVDRLAEWPDIQQEGLVGYLEKSMIVVDLYVSQNVYDRFLNN